ncbi:ParA family protein [Legionella gresilensis]|uniref:ParA family protein n=1 Tax=Legionella gresilensis TaxID=91823 RepID=UPI00104106B1|nr:AAA family ATPase [Legionella gresilensis]
MKTISARDFSAIINVSPHLIYKLIKDNDLEVIPIANRKVLPASTAREILELRGFNYKPNKRPTIINIFGMKGGIGKTSLATAIAEGASRLGFRVLAVDLDMQANLTQSFNMKKHGQPVIVHVLNKQKKLREIIKEVTPYLHLLPSSLDNSQVEQVLGSQTINAAGYFKNLFSELEKNYDLIILDCPPSINKITSCAACYATTNLIPLNADIDSFDGVIMSVSEIIQIQESFKDFNIEIDYKIIFNKYDAREKLSLTIMGEVANRDELRENLLPIVVRTNTAFKNTKADGEYIFDLKNSTAKEDCWSLISEITGISSWLETKTNKKNEILKKEAAAV